MFTDLWNKAASDSTCPNYEVGSPAHTQKECQVLCEAKSESECVGISYSHKTGIDNWCYLCKDDTLRPVVGTEFGFYRRRGIFRMLLWLINRNFNAKIE